MTRLFALAALLAMSAGSAEAQAPLITGLGGPLDFGTDSPPRSDDDAMPTAISLTATFPGGIDFYGPHYTDVFVNINGSLTFGAGIGTFTPDLFPRPLGSVPMIAGWWANADTRPIPAGAPDTNQIYYAATPAHFVVTWIDVGYFDMKIDRLNAFQIVLSPPTSGLAGAFDVEFRYHRCEWTTGDDLASGGTGGLGGHPAQAGFDAGDGIHFVALAGSGTDAVLALCTTTNGAGSGGGGPGDWGLTIGPARCGNGFVELGEDCDDGNREPHDFCDNFCRSSVPCYTAFPDGGHTDPFRGVDAAVDASGGVAACFVPPDAAVVPEDAAIVPEDAATVRPDAGRRPDAGTRFDAGPVIDASVHRDAGRTLNELDVTGGGCGCRVSRARSATALYGIALALFSLTRIRARARARAGTTRRP